MCVNYIYNTVFVLYFVAKGFLLKDIKILYYNVLVTHICCSRFIMGDFIVFKDALKQYEWEFMCMLTLGYIKIFVWSLNRNVMWFMGFYDLKSSNTLVVLEFIIYLRFLYDII